MIISQGSQWLIFSNYNGTFVFQYSILKGCKFVCGMLMHIQEACCWARGCLDYLAKVRICKITCQKWKSTRFWYFCCRLNYLCIRQEFVHFFATTKTLPTKSIRNWLAMLYVIFCCQRIICYKFWAFETVSRRLIPACCTYYKVFFSSSSSFGWVLQFESAEISLWPSR